MSAHPVQPPAGGAAIVAAPPAYRSRRWGIVAALAVTETVSWGILYYAFAVFLGPMRADLGASTTQLTVAFAVALLMSAIAGIAVGRHLDRRGPRALMTSGSIAAVLLVLALSRAESLLALYVIWALLGVAMAAVLYEAAFTVLAKEFTAAAERRRAMTAVTLAGALASFIFLPVSQALVDAYGWRDALVVLAVVLGVTTIPLHALVLRPAPAPMPDQKGLERSVEARAALRSSPFWLLSGAFVLATLISIAMTVHAIPYLIERGHSPQFAAFTVGLIGISQIPGRLLFSMVARLPPELATSLVFALIASGIAVTASSDSITTVLAGLVLLGMGNGMTTLLRATRLADLYGPAAYGSIASVAAAATTAARAAGPVAAALLVAAAGYETLLWVLTALATAAGVLAYCAESGQQIASSVAGCALTPRTRSRLS